MSIFHPGKLVFAKSTPSIIGAVISVTSGSDEDRIQVLMNGELKTFYSSQLQLVETPEAHETCLAGERFHATLTAKQIQCPALSTLYSLNAARIDFIPYQFRPVLRFIRSDRPRLLIADDVGVGKTIEAGLILRELQARHEVTALAGDFVLQEVFACVVSL